LALPILFTLLSALGRVLAYTLGAYVCQRVRVVFQFNFSFFGNIYSVSVCCVSGKLAVKVKRVFAFWARG